MRFPKVLIRLTGRIQRVLYRASGGRIGGRVGKAGVLLLTTMGRRSGKARTVPLLFVPDGDGFVIVASLGGHDAHPAWYRNLRANPVAAVQVGRTTTRVESHEVGAEERERLWPILVATYPAWGEYRTRTAREFPILALRPLGGLRHGAMAGSIVIGDDFDDPLPPDIREAFGA